MTATKSTLEKYQAVTSRAELADLLGIRHSALTYLLYVKEDDKKYSTFLIPKKNGGNREIHAPIPELKLLQKRVAEQLELCIIDLEKTTGKHNKSSHGFVQGKSILTNASVHRNKRYVFNLDLKDFFPTISGKRIRGLLINDRTLQFPPVVATTLAHIACRQGVLPQGSPCSPVISNLIARILDVHLSRLAKDYGCRYTRYADDITFSTNKRVFPIELATLGEASPHKWQIGSKLAELIARAGFSINETKTRMQYKTSRQTVTGIVVNDRINVPSEYRKLVRAYVFALINHGNFEIRNASKNEDGKVVEKIEQGTTAQLNGMLGFIHAVDNVVRTDQRLHPYNYPNRSVDSKKTTGNLTIYRRFLLYTRFYANELPLLVCEGKTDNVYISAAIHQLQKKFPKLTKQDPATGKNILAIRFIKYARQHRKKRHIYTPNFSTVSILGGESGGTGNLSKLLKSYWAEYAKFKSKPGKNPVLFIIDNDSGGKAFYKTVTNTLKITIDTSQPFTRLFANVYVIPISAPGKAESAIEDLFDQSDIKKGLDGRSFDFSKDADPTKTYGKEAFAYRFVAQKSSQLNWGGFTPLLQAVCDSLTDYSNVIKT